MGGWPSSPPYESPEEALQSSLVTTQRSGRHEDDSSAGRAYPTSGPRGEAVHGGLSPGSGRIRPNLQPPPDDGLWRSVGGKGNSGQM